MPIPVEEREHNGDYINRAEKVGRLYKLLHTDMADHTAQVHGITAAQEATSACRRLHVLSPKGRSDEVMTSGQYRSEICMAGVGQYSHVSVLGIDSYSE